MKKFVKLATLVFGLIGANLYLVTPFPFIRFYYSDGEKVGIIEQLLVAVASIILVVPQAIIVLAALLLIVVGTAVRILTPGPTDKLIRYYESVLDVYINFANKQCNGHKE